MKNIKNSTVQKSGRNTWLNLEFIESNIRVKNIRMTSNNKDRSYNF